MWNPNLNCGDDPAQALLTSAWLHPGRSHSQEAQQECSPSPAPCVLLRFFPCVSVTVFSCLAWPEPMLSTAKLVQKWSSKEGAKRKKVGEVPCNWEWVLQSPWRVAALVPCAVSEGDFYKHHPTATRLSDAPGVWTGSHSEARALPNLGVCDFPKFWFAYSCLLYVTM